MGASRRNLLIAEFVFPAGGGFWRHLSDIRLVDMLKKAPCRLVLCSAIQINRLIIFLRLTRLLLLAVLLRYSFFKN